MSHRKILGALLLLVCGHALAAPWHHLPGAPATGFGSSSGYVTDNVTSSSLGSGYDGSYVFIYEPAVLKNGTKAPVVVFLHGFAALNPYTYRTHINHLVRQGNIVIYPQYQIALGAGVLRESGIQGMADQTVWARRAVDATMAALDKLGSKADRDQIYLYGHSLGGLISVAWEQNGGPRPVRYTLSHPAFDATAGMPPFVRSLVKVKSIDWQVSSRFITAPVTFLHGEDDMVAPTTQSDALAAQLKSQGVSYVYYKARHDGFGWPALSPNHGAPLDLLYPIPANLKLFGMSFELNALDYRYYFAGLDAVMAGKGDSIPFDFGAWSNGRKVLMPIVQSRYPE